MKRGQIGVTQIILGLLVLFIIIVIGVAGFNSTNNGSSFSDALSESMDSVSTGFINVLGPIFDVILGLSGDTNTDFLMILSFILISIIIVGTLDSVNIFGESTGVFGGSNLINLAVGIIVSIIGVRFMPSDIWFSLTAPSSAFVATILVGAPFLAFFFVTMKIKFPLARKLFWLFYLVFMSYLIFFPETGAGLSNRFMWIYIIFLILASIMLFFDSTVRKFISKEKYKFEVEKEIAGLDVKARSKLRADIEDWNEIISDPNASPTDRRFAKMKLKQTKEIYGDLSSI